MASKRLRRLAEAIGGKFIGRVPEGDPAGLAACYQSRRIASMPLLETVPEEGQSHGAGQIESVVSPARQSEHNPTTVAR